jgi:hypothetical protein
MTADFGYQKSSQPTVGLRETVSGGFMVKEIRLWAEQREDDKLFWRRNQQIDPELEINNKIISYYRLLA